MVSSLVRGYWPSAADVSDLSTSLGALAFCGRARALRATFLTVRSWRFGLREESVDLWHSPISDAECFRTVSGCFKGILNFTALQNDLRHGHYPADSLAESFSLKSFQRQDTNKISISTRALRACRLQAKSENNKLRC